MTKTSLQTWGQKVSWGFLLLGILYVLYFFIDIFFISSAAEKIVKADYWRHLHKIILPLLYENGDLRLLWSNHHPAPILHLHQIAIMKLTDLQLNFDAYVGLVLQLFISIVLIKMAVNQFAIRQVAFTRQTKFLMLTVQCLIISIVLSMTVPNIYFWPLISLQGYPLLLGCLFALLVGQFASMTNPKQRWIWLIFSSAVIIMISNSSFGTIFVISAGLVVLFRGIIIRNLRFVYTGLGLFIVLALWTFLLDNVMLNSSSAFGNGKLELDLLFHLSNIHSYFLAFSQAIVKAVIDSNTFSGREGIVAVKIALNGLAVFFGLIYIAALVYSLKRGGALLGASVILVTGLVFASGVVLFRGGDTFPWGLNANRYGLTFKITFACAVPIIAVFILDSTKKFVKLQSRLINGFMMLGLLLITFQVHSSISSFDKIPYLKRAQRSSELRLFMVGYDPANNFRLPRSIVGANKNYDKVLEFLVKEELNVFSPKYPKSPLVQEYKVAYDHFTSSENPTVLFSYPEKFPGDAPGLRQVGERRLCGQVRLPSGFTTARIKVESNKKILQALNLKWKDVEREVKVNFLEGIQFYYFLMPKSQIMNICFHKDTKALHLEAIKVNGH